MASLLPSLDALRYRSAILLKNEAFFQKNVEIVTGEAFLTSPGSNDTSGAVSVEFFANPRFSMVYAWKLYLFL